MAPTCMRNGRAESGDQEEKDSWAERTEWGGLVNKSTKYREVAKTKTAGPGQNSDRKDCKSCRFQRCLFSGKWTSKFR